MLCACFHRRDVWSHRRRDKEGRVQDSWGLTENVGYRELGGQSIVLSFSCLAPQYTNIIFVATSNVKHSSDTTHSNVLSYSKHQKGLQSSSSSTPYKDKYKRASLGTIIKT
jgi:hypothetical protein